MLTVGDVFPEFKLKGVVDLAPGKEFKDFTRGSFPGQWLVVFSWPMDFTFVCPTEIAEFGRQAAAFRERKAQVVGFSGDTQYVHLAWRMQHPDLKALEIPMLADTQRTLSTQLGILDKVEGVPLRATFIVSPDHLIRWVCVNDLDVGRSVDEVLRVLDGLQSGGMTPCNWKKGEKTL
jgi:peroxiredoxin (alkyl hydroperoxide reductase subunit C)